MKFLKRVLLNYCFRCKKLPTFYWHVRKGAMAHNYVFAVFFVYWTQNSVKRKINNRFLSPWPPLTCSSTISFHPAFPLMVFCVYLNSESFQCCGTGLFFSGSGSYLDMFWCYDIFLPNLNILWLNIYTFNTGLRIRNDLFRIRIRIYLFFIPDPDPDPTRVFKLIKIT